MIYKLHTYSDGSTMLSADIEAIQISADNEGSVEVISVDVLNIGPKEFNQLQKKHATHDLTFDTSTGKVSAILKPMLKPKNKKLDK